MGIRVKIALVVLFVALVGGVVWLLASSGRTGGKAVLSLSAPSYTRRDGTNCVVFWLTNTGSHATCFGAEGQYVSQQSGGGVLLYKTQDPRGGGRGRTRILPQRTHSELILSPSPRPAMGYMVMYRDARSGGTSSPES